MELKAIADAEVSQHGINIDLGFRSEQTHSVIFVHHINGDVATEFDIGDACHRKPILSKIIGEAE